MVKLLKSLAGLGGAEPPHTPYATSASLGAGKVAFF
jgi:hypothetical protein